MHQRPAASDQAALKRVIERIGLLQLDSISVVARSHYLVMLARARLVRPGTSWTPCSIAASSSRPGRTPCANCRRRITPGITLYIQQKQLKESQWQLDRFDIDMAPIIENVLETIRQRGPLSSKDFESERRGDGGWWNWKPTKVALEYLFDYGELMVSHRVKFQRYLRPARTRP